MELPPLSRAAPPPPYIEGEYHPPNAVYSVSFVVNRFNGELPALPQSVVLV